MVVEIGVEERVHLRVGVDQTVERVPDHAGDRRPVCPLESGQEVGGRRSGGGADEVHLGRVPRMQFGGCGHSAAALRVPGEHGARRGSDVRTRDPRRGTGDVQHGTGRGLAVDVRVDAGRAQPLVVGHRDRVAAGQQRVGLDEFVAEAHAGRVRADGGQVLEGLRRRAVVGLTLGARCEHCERPRPRAGPRRAGLEVRPRHGDWLVSRPRGGVHDALGIGRDRARAVRDELRPGDRWDGAGEWERLGLDECSRACGQLGGRLIERGSRVVGRALGCGDRGERGPAPDGGRQSGGECGSAQRGSTK